MAKIDRLLEKMRSRRKAGEERLVMAWVYELCDRTPEKPEYCFIEGVLHEKIEGVWVRDGEQERYKGPFLLRCQLQGKNGMRELRSIHPSMEWVEREVLRHPGAREAVVIYQRDYPHGTRLDRELVVSG